MKGKGLKKGVFIC